MLAEGEDEQTSSSCKPTDNVSFSSITTSGATVNWSAVSGAVSYFLYWQPTGGGTEHNIQVSGTSVALTDLKACTEYRVRIRTRCGPTDFSEFTAWSNFETGSTNPSVSIVTEPVWDGCGVALTATEGFQNYCWTLGSNNRCSGDTSTTLMNASGLIWLEAFDASGCSAVTSAEVASFPSNCLTHEQDAELRDSLMADSTLHRNDIRMLAIGMASLMKNDTVKSLVKTLAKQFFNSHCSEQHVARLDLLADSCAQYGISLTSTLKEVVWSNWEVGSLADTSRIPMLVSGFTANDTRGTTIQTYINYCYLDEEFNQITSYPSWDSVSASAVSAVVFHDLDNIPSYTVDSEGQIIESFKKRSDYITSEPVWQIALGPLDVRNTTRTGIINYIPTNSRCSCYHWEYKGDSGSICSSAGRACDCSTDCNTWQKFKTWLGI